MPSEVAPGTKSRWQASPVCTARLTPRPWENVTQRSPKPAHLDASSDSERRSRADVGTVHCSRGASRPGLLDALVPSCQGLAACRGRAVAADLVAVAAGRCVLQAFGTGHSEPGRWSRRRAGGWCRHRISLRDVFISGRNRPPSPRRHWRGTRSTPTGVDLARRPRLLFVVVPLRVQRLGVGSRSWASTGHGCRVTSVTQRRRDSVPVRPR